MMQEFVHETNKAIQEALKGVHTSMPGKIVSFDPSTGLATVLPMMKFRKPDGSTMEYPQITGVPVMFPQSMNQQATIAYPIKPDDGCIILAAEQSIDYWMYGQETDTDLDFDLTNSICIPGLFVPANQVMKKACDENAIIADLKGTFVKIREPEIILDVKGTCITIKSGEVIIDAAKVTINGNVQLNGQEVATGDVKANTAISLATHTHTGNLGTPTSPPL